MVVYSSQVPGSSSTTTLDNGVSAEAWGAWKVEPGVNGNMIAVPAPSRDTMVPTAAPTAHKRTKPGSSRGGGAALAPLVPCPICAFFSVRKKKRQGPQQSAVHPGVASHAVRSRPVPKCCNGSDAQQPYAVAFSSSWGAAQAVQDVPVPRACSPVVRRCDFTRGQLFHFRCFCVFSLGCVAVRARACERERN